MANELTGSDDMRPVDPTEVTVEDGSEPTPDENNTPQENDVPGDAAGAVSADHKDHGHPETGVCPVSCVLRGQ